MHSIALMGRGLNRSYKFFVLRFKNILEIHENQKNINAEAKLQKKMRFKVSGTSMGQMFCQRLKFQKIAEIHQSDL